MVSTMSNNNFISVQQKIRKKFKSAVTDSGRDVLYDRKEKAAISNLLTIYGIVSGEAIADIEKKYAGKGYGDFKKDLGDAVVSFLEPIQERLRGWQSRPDDIRDILLSGAEKARQIAAPKLEEVKSKLGLSASKIPVGGRK